MVQTAIYIPETHSIQEIGGSGRLIKCDDDYRPPAIDRELVEDLDYFVWRFSDNSELVIGFEKPLVTLSQ